MENEIRYKLLNLLGCSGLSGEDHLRTFLNVIGNYEIDHEDVIMKFFMQSLVDDA